MIWEGDMDFWQPAEQPEVMIVGPTRSGGPTIMNEGCSKGCQKSMPHETNHVITIITTCPIIQIISTPITLKYTILYDNNHQQQQQQLPNQKNKHCNAII